MKKFLSLFLCFLTIFFCAGCGEKETKKENPPQVSVGGLNEQEETLKKETGTDIQEETPPVEEAPYLLSSGYSFSPGGGEPWPEIVCFTAYKSKQNEFDLNAVELTVSYSAFGWSRGTPFKKNGAYPEGVEDIFMRVIFANLSAIGNGWTEITNESLSYTVKEIDDETYFSAAYGCDYKEESVCGGGHLTIDYYHSEQVTIPSALFVGEKGCIIFGVGSTEKYADGNEEIENIVHWMYSAIFYRVEGERVILSSTEFEE